MNTLTSKINKKVFNSLSSFNVKISEKFGMDIEDLENLLNKAFKDGVKIKKVEKSRTEIPGEETFCPYTFSRGARSGEVCNSKVKIEGRIFCTKHKKYEKNLPSESGKDSLDISYLKGKKKNVIANKIILLKHPKLRMPYHAETGIVFDSSMIAIGILSENDTIKDLTSLDIQTCKQYKFKLHL